MPIGNYAGHARLSRRNPRAMGECDTCGFWYQLDDLARQFQWGGVALRDTGYLVCHRCLDVPQEQLRSIILPPDPYPRSNPRPSYDTTGMAPATTPGNQGFTQYVLDGGTSATTAPPAGIGYFIIGVSAIGVGSTGGAWDGQSTPGNYPTDKASVLQQVAQLSGIPTPVPNTDDSIVVTATNQTLPWVPANPNRSWLLLYNPAQPVSFFSTGTAILGATTNLAIGPGGAWFWATAQGFGTVYQGAITAIGLTANVPLWAWEA
jgi:hypothetical protein